MTEHRPDVERDNQQDDEPADTPGGEHEPAGDPGGRDTTFATWPYLREAAPTCAAMTVGKLGAALVAGSTMGVDHHWVRRFGVLPFVVFETDRVGLARITAWSTLVATALAVALLVLHGLRARTHARFLGGALGILAAGEMIVVDSLTRWGPAPEDVIVSQLLSAGLFVVGVALVGGRLLRDGRGSRLIPRWA